MRYTTQQGCRFMWMSYRPHYITVDICWYYSIVRVFTLWQDLPLRRHLPIYLFIFIQKRTKKIKSFKGSLNALECRLTGFNMGEIIQADLQVSGVFFLTEEALLLACNCKYISRRRFLPFLRCLPVRLQPFRSRSTHLN